MPEWLDVVLERNLHFSPVVSVQDARRTGGVRRIRSCDSRICRERHRQPQHGQHAPGFNGGRHCRRLHPRHGASVSRRWRSTVMAQKTAQALRTDAQKDAPAPADIDAIVNEAVSKAVADAGPKRKRMPRERESITHKFWIGGLEGYITAGKYEDGSVGEIFLTDIGKEGSTLRGMMNSFATADLDLAAGTGCRSKRWCRSSATCALTRRSRLQPRDSVCQVDARLHHALARLAFLGCRCPGGAWHPRPRRYVPARLSGDASVGHLLGYLRAQRHSGGGP